MIKLSDLDLDIPSKESTTIKDGMVRATIINDRGDAQPHPAGVYFYKDIPSYQGLSLLDFKQMEQHNYQKIDILNNTYLDNLTEVELNMFVTLIEEEDIDWSLLWAFKKPYQLSKYPGILREFKVSSVLDVAILIALIRPGALPNYDKMLKFIHTDTLLKRRTDDIKIILGETYGIAVFDEQFKKLGINDGKYRYKKPHSIGYAYVLLIDFLKNTQK